MNEWTGHCGIIPLGTALCEVVFNLSPPSLLSFLDCHHYHNTENVNDAVFQVGYNLLGAVLFTFVGSVGVESWWSVRTDLHHMSKANLYVIEHLNNIKLLSAILSLVNAVFYAAETVIEGVILHDFCKRN
jgi:hypothetical protein